MTIVGPIAIEDVTPVRWKNGGGTTRTLVVEPADAGMDDFSWRISVAEIGESGGFSVFPGIDRTIMLWQGEGVVLRSSAWPERSLTKRWEPFEFGGEEDVACELAGGVTEDLNLMVRRGVVAGEMRCSREEVMVEEGWDDVVVLCAVGVVRVEGMGVVVRANQLLRISGVEGGVRFVPEAGAVFVYAVVRKLG